MRANAMIALAGAAVLAATTAGCKDKAEEISSPSYSFGLQDKFWADCRAQLHSGSAEPNLDPLRSVWRFLKDRTARSVQRTYTGANKDQVLAALKKLQADYGATVIGKLDIMGHRVRLAGGATLEEVRAAFDQLDPDYRALQALVSAAK